MQKKVTIYSTPSCHFCNLAKQFFADNDITYTEHDVVADVEKRQEMLERSGQMSVPVIHIEDSGGKEEPAVVIGFDEPNLRMLLGIS